MNSTTLMIMPSLKKGGAEKQFDYLFRGLRAKEHSCYILLNSDDADLDREIFSIKSSSEIFFVKEFLLALKILKIKNRYQITHVIVYDVYGLYLIPFLKLLGLHVIYSERNSGIHRHKIGYWCIGLSDMITANSTCACQHLKTILNHQVLYIPNGVAVKSSETEVQIKCNQYFKILVPARIDHVKNQKLVVEAAKKLKNIEIHFAGIIENQEYYEEIFAEVKRFQLQDVVIYDGFIQNMAEYYKTFDLILLPSLSEGTSNVILECYANKYLCLISDIEMNQELIISDKTTFQSNQVQSLVEKIECLKNLTDYEAAEILNHGYQLILQNYSMEKMIDSYIKIIEGALYETDHKDQI